MTRTPAAQGSVVQTIRDIENFFIQLLDEVATLEESIAPILKPENANGCGTEKGDQPARCTIANELDLHLDRIRTLRDRVSNIISRVDI